MASIGDSRAVIGTQVLPAVLPIKEQDSGHTDCLIATRKNRKLPSTLYSMQMTKDQKPELPEELTRILEKGGRVQQLLDDTGNKIGPYRVFDMKGNYPGLAMSRSLGDVLGTQVGIISTPMFSKHKLNKEADSFLVLASDGVWDVMDNQEVVDFVEHFRFKCQKDLQNPITGVEITFENTCIAQLLCEEARTRWYSIVEVENVMIDDISCIILEFHQKANPSAQEISYIPMANFGDFHVSDVRRATTINEISTRDPRRGSFCAPK